MIVSLAIAGAGFSLALILTMVIRHLCRERDTLRRRVERSTHELERLLRSFSRFAPAEPVERIIEAGSLGSGERREVIVMFADIRDFTRISEMSRIIRAHHGHVTRIMGDGIMSVFGALEQNPWHALDAVEAAVDMKQALDRYNEGLRTRRFPGLRFGIGIHCGTVVAGVVGSEELLEFTVMGDVVNVASRIEGLTRQFDSDILITNEVRDRIGDGFSLMEMRPAYLKGKSNYIATWALLGLHTG
jgi:adenylate cyclase